MTEHSTNSDTQPRRPIELPDSSWTTPLDTSKLLAPEAENTAGRCLLTVFVMGASTFLCLAVILLSVIAGYRDELKAIQTKTARDLRGTVTVQYGLALEAENNGLSLLAHDRYTWIQTQMPNFQDVEARLGHIQVVMAYTPTPTITLTPSISPTPSPEPTATLSPSPSIAPVEAHFNEASRYFNLGYYEKAIEWLKVVQASDPSYRSLEVNQMLFSALASQADIYFDGRNPTEAQGEGPNGYPGYMLARGVQLTTEAVQLRANNPAAAPNWTDPDRIVYTSGFVQRYLSAKAYVDAGDYMTALPILEALCLESCGWGYYGETVQNLLDRARTGT